MNFENPELQPPQIPADKPIQPGSLDFVETPDVVPSAEGHEPLPIWLYLICGFALFMAGSSFTGFNTFGFGLLDQGQGAPAMTNARETQGATAADPMALGKKLYGANCASCHQASGEGQPGSYPPLVGSEWVLGSKERLAAVLFKGLQGQVTVKGSTFGTMAMPAQESVLTPEKIANLMTYIRGSWGNTANAVTVDEVNTAKTKVASQSAAYNEAELLKIAPHGPDPSDKK